MHPTTARTGSWHAAVIVAVALALACVGVGSQVSQVDGLPPDPRSPAYPNPTEKPEVLLNAHDGKFFAELAKDPALTHPERFGADLGLHATRPLFSWLAWLAALGRPGRVAWALMALTALSIAALVAATIALSRAFGRDPESPLVLAALAGPGVLALLVFPGLDDALGAALALAGLAAWKRDRNVIAIALFAAAGLCHEALLLFPLALFVREAAERRAWPGGRWLIPIMPYVAWLAFVGVRGGVWPVESRQGNVGLPLSGLLSAVRNEWYPLDALCLMVVVLAGVAAWKRIPEPAVRIIIGTYAALAIVAGPYVWNRWVDFSRMLLPVFVLGVVALIPPASAPADPSDERLRGTMADRTEPTPPRVPSAKPRPR